MAESAHDLVEAEAVQILASCSHPRGPLKHQVLVAQIQGLALAHPQLLGLVLRVNTRTGEQHMSTF